MAVNENELTEKKQRFQEALQQFLDRIESDRSILAAVLVGSISDETIWRKESIHLWVIEADGVQKRLKSDGNHEDIHRTMVEDDINLHLEMIPRSRFKQMVEGSSRTAFSCNFFASRELVYCDDPSIAKWFDSAQEVATKDQEKELLQVTTWAIHAIKHARKQLNIKEDHELAKQTLIWGAHSIACIEIVKAGEVYEDTAIYKAIEIRPELFQVIYTDLLTRKTTAKLLASALAAMTEYIDNHWREYLKPMLHFLNKQQRVVPLSELANHFAFSQLYPWHLESACEWLADLGYIEKLSAPFKLTKRSRVDVEEPAFLVNE